MAFDVRGARKAGYSEAEIADFLAKEQRFDTANARKAGYSDAEIISHLAKPNKVKDVAKSYASGLVETVGGIADMVAGASPLGMVEGAFKAAGNVRNVFQGKRPTAVSPFSRVGDTAARVSHKPQTSEGRVAKTFGQNTLNAVAPGSAPARFVNVFAPAIGTEVGGMIGRAVGGDKGEAYGRVGGGVAGAGGASVRPGNVFRPETGPGVVGSRARQDPTAMRDRAARYRASNVEPTLVDVVDDAGRGIIKAAASRASGGRQVANDFADARALNMPDRVGQQARRNMSRDPRNPGEIREQLTRQRSANADRAFGAVRGDVVDLGEDALTTFRVPEVADAVMAASRLERDPATRGALVRLAQWAQSGSAPGQAPPITVGMADRISRVLLGKARETQNPDMRATMTQFGEMIRSPTRQASGGYATALEGYAADSRLAGAVDVGENFMQRNTDEFVRGAAPLPPRERALALAAGRRTVERAVGENPASAPGVARRLAEAPEQQARNAALMGPQRAGRFQEGLRMEGDALQNAQQVAPGRGSPSHLNISDEARLEGAVSLGRQVASQGFTRAALSQGMDWLRSRGISDDQAEAIVRMAIDPQQTDQAIALIAQRLGEGEARQFLQWRNAALIAAASGTMGARTAPEDPQGR